MKLNFKKLLLWTSVTISLLLIGLIFISQLMPESVPSETSSNSHLNKSSMQTVSAKIHTTQFTLYSPQTASERQVGLAAFDSLQAHEGMIFKGLQPDSLSIWMKNMKFDIDVIWLDENDTITYIEKSISKNSYQKIYQNPTSAPSTYLIELPAGTVEQMTINLGDKVTLQ